MFSALLEKTWWAKTASPLTTLLTPFSALYGVVIAARRELYSRGILARSHPGVPVLVVGNVVVGGAGKTPVVQVCNRRAIGQELSAAVIPSARSNREMSPYDPSRQTWATSRSCTFRSGCQ